jgi:hypothetical protein
MPTPLDWLVMTGWPTVGELARFSGVARSTISRQLNGVPGDPERLGWKDNGLVVSRSAGRLLRPAERLLATSKLLGQMYEQRHTHPGPDDYHVQHPFYPDDWDHLHPTHFNGKVGAEFQYESISKLTSWCETPLL